MTHAHSFRAMSALAFVTVLGTAAVTPAPMAHARMPHIGLASSSPAKDAHVMTPLKEIRLTFTGPINVASAGVELASADNKAVALDSLRAVADSPRVAVARVTGAMANGTYTVRWKAVAADGAAGSGTFNFMYMAAKTEPVESARR